MHKRSYTAWGVLFGLFFPISGMLLQAALDPSDDGVWIRLSRAQSSPLLWIIDLTPLFMGIYSAVMGRREDLRMAAEEVRRTVFVDTSAALFKSAQQLLSTVSSFSALSAETAASVRQTTATMEQLAHTATHAALTAETVVGLAGSSQRCADEGLRAVENSTLEMLALAEDVRELSGRVEGLNDRMKDILEVASVVDTVSERSRAVAGRAADELTRSPGSGRFGEVVAEMRRHSEDAQRSAQTVKRILAEVHKAMMSAMTAAEKGIQRAERGAEVAASTGDAIRRLAAALKDSSDAAREIAQVAQQQDRSVDEVQKAMNAIFLATEQTVEGAREVAGGANSLHELAERLEESVRPAA